MKKRVNYIIFLLISMFALSMSVSAAQFSVVADGEWHVIADQYSFGGSKAKCEVVSGPAQAKIESNKCMVKTNSVATEDFSFVVNLYGSGPMGAMINGNHDVWAKSQATQNAQNSGKTVKYVEYNADGEWHNISVTGAISDCSKSSGGFSFEWDKSNYICKVKSDSSATGVVKVTHGSVGSSWVTEVHITFKGNTNSNVNNNSDSSKNDSSDYEFLDICDPNESPQTVATFKLIGIFISIIKIVAPIIIIVMGMLDLFKAVSDGKDGSIQKQLISFLKRVIACLLIFFVPNILLELFHFVDGWDDVRSEYEVCVNCILGDPSCPKANFVNVNGSGNSNSSGNSNGHNGMPSDIEAKYYNN